MAAGFFLWGGSFVAVVTSTVGMTSVVVGGEHRVCWTDIRLGSAQRKGCQAEGGARRKGVSKGGAKWRGWSRRRTSGRLQYYC